VKSESEEAVLRQTNRFKKAGTSHPNKFQRPLQQRDL